MVQTIRFQAMGSPCEVQVDSEDAGLAEQLGRIARAEALRIEYKYSRYLPGSVVGQINALAGLHVMLDPETASLVAYADACYRMSGGRFDITSGVLRKAWRFDGSNHVPDPAAIAALLPHIGWDKVEWSGDLLTLERGMEIDLGGLGKEYAVDMVLARIAKVSAVPVLVNFGGDLRVTGPRVDGSPWRVQIETVREGQAQAWLELTSGAITTSGDSRRFVERGGRRYCHILDPRSGMPITGAPRAITVAAASCIEAGVLSTLGMLQGEHAEAFLKEEGICAWISR